MTKRRKWKISKNEIKKKARKKDGSQRERGRNKERKT